MKTHFIGITLLCLLFLSCSSDDKINETIINHPSTTQSPEINSFALNLVTASNKKTKQVASICNESKIIEWTTLSWIENLDALSFEIEAEGQLYIGDHILDQGSTIDFSKREIKCKLVGEKNVEVEYSLILNCPQTSGLPVVSISTEDGIDISTQSKSKDYVKCDIELKDKNHPKYNFNVKGGVRGRGNSTWGLPKKPMRIKLDEKRSVLGLPKEKSWVLLANYLDPTYLMNSVAFELAKRMNLEFTNTDYHVELFYNGKYWGNYQLTEQVQVKSNRIVVDKKEGYLVELDSYFDDEFKFRTTEYQLPVMVKYPEVKSDAEMNFIRKDFEVLENIMLSEDFSTTDLSPYVDIEALAKYMMVFEMTGNTELEHPKSVKLYKKDKDSPMSFGPVWDFDWAYGKQPQKGKFTYFENPQNLILVRGNNSTLGYRFFTRFFENKEFLRTYKSLFLEFKEKGVFNMDEFIENKVIELQYSAALDHSLWKDRPSFKGQIELMKEWLLKHQDAVSFQVNNY